MNKFSKERILYGVILLLSGLFVSAIAVNKFIKSHVFWELIVYLITPAGIVISALSLFFGREIKTFLRIVSITTLTSSIGLMLIASVIYSSASKLQSTPDTMLPGINAIGAMSMYFAVLIDIFLAFLSLIAGGLGLGIAKGHHWCTGAAFYAFILIFLCAIAVPDTVGHVFQLIVLTSTVTYYKSNQSVQLHDDDAEKRG